MKTRITIEDAALAVVPLRSAVRTAVPDQPEIESIDAGSAPRAGSPTAAPSSGIDVSDGGTPPDWLVDAIAQAGGMTAPESPEDIEIAGLDAGPAPA
ncbi:MAG TPA: hypothetical protein VIT65_05430 [Microlunatus sp.]